MKAKSLLILFLLASGLLTYVYYGIQKPSEEMAEHGKPEDRLAPGDFAKLEWINLKTSNLSLKLERQKIGWKITEPVKDIASQSKVESLISGLEKFRRTKVLFSPEELAKSSPDKKQFGLLTPRSSVTYKLSNLPTPLDVFVGNPNPAATATFAETKARGLVLATMDLDYLANQTVNDFREMRLTTVNANDFAEVKVENKSGAFKLVKENDLWKMVEPTLPADPEIIRNFVDKISFVRATEFVDKVPASAGKPLAKVIVGFQKETRDQRSGENDQRPQGMELSFYQEAAKPQKKSKDQEKPEDLYYVLSDKAGAAKTNSYHFENFQKKAGDFVKKTFDDFLLASLKSAHIKTKSEDFEIVRQADGAYKSKETNLDKDKVEALLNQIRSLKADTFVATAKALPQDADLTVTLNLENGSRAFSFKGAKDHLSFWLKKETNILEYRASPKILLLPAFSLNALKPEGKKGK